MERCDALWEVLHKYAMCTPSHDDELKIAQEFEEKWDFPNCFGALDGKHIVIQAPPNSGSQLYYYKGTSSTVLMALVLLSGCGYWIVWQI